MIARISFLTVACGLGAYFGLSTDRSSDGKLSINKATTALVTKTETQSVPEPQTFLTFDNSRDVSQVVETQIIADAELEMDDSLDSLHLMEFTEYLRGERASESTTLAFYTDSRWSEFYNRVGYPSEDIHQLIAFRNQYLADASQSRKEYYWHRWSDAPDRALADSLVYKIIQYLGNGENNESILSNSISEIASEYGIAVSLVERVAKTYLLNSIDTIESTSSIFNASFDPKVEVIKFDSDFVEYLKEQAGYQKR
ncbi:TPA: hypothetical protein ACGF6U_002622 [Vibrio cholerae]